MATKSRLQDKYQIEPETWQHLKRMYWIVFFSPFMFASVFAGIIWVVFKFASSDFSWLLYLLLPWLLVFFANIVLYRQFFIRSKITVVLRASIVCTFQFTLFLCVIAGAFELFGHYGIYLNMLFLFASIYLFYKWMRHWDILWESNQFHNENTVIDPDNARFEIFNGFNYDEKKAKRKGYKPFLRNINIYMAPMVFFALILIISGIEFPFGPIQIYFSYWLLTAFFYLAFTHPTTALFHTYGKIVHMEKVLGKHVINGLLAK